MNNEYEKALVAAQYIQKKIDNKKITASILSGTGLSLQWEKNQIVVTIDYADIPHLNFRNLQGHHAKVELVHIDNKYLLNWCGRLHFYEGYHPKEITFIVRINQQLGIENIWINNVAGAIGSKFNVGDLVIIKDHINFMGFNSLRGENIPKWGLRFPSFESVYSERLKKLAESSFQENGMMPKYGVYFGLQGPNLETPSEYKMINKMGADLVGMSTIPEVIAAKHGNQSILVISLVSNVFDENTPIEKTTV